MPGLLLTSSSDVCWVGVVWTRVPGQLSAVTCPVPSIPPSPDTGRPPRVSTPHLRIYISMLDIYYLQPTFISIYLLSMLDIYYLHPTSISIYLCWISTLHLHINAGYLHCTSVSMIDIYYLHRTCISMLDIYYLHCTPISTLCCNFYNYNYFFVFQRYEQLKVY